MNVSIGKRQVGEGKPCFIIAEAGVNHNGSLELAKDMVKAAKGAGADAVKFQTFSAEELATASAGKASYQKLSGGAGETQLEMLEKMELSEDDFRELSGCCAREDIIFLSTPFDFGSIDLLERLQVPAYKISSGDLNNYPFLEYVAGKGKPMIISTGMSELEEIKTAVGTVKGAGNGQVILMQCTTAYPAPFADVNLNAIRAMKEIFGLPVGLSDHTLGIEVSIAAAALGACAVEKHFTMDKGMSGPDHKASIEPEELARMASSIRHVEAALGSGIKTVSSSEAVNRETLRKRIVAKVGISKGEILSEKNLAIKRSSAGLEPAWMGRLVGKKSRRAIKKDGPLMEDDAA